MTSWPASWSASSAWTEVEQCGLCSSVKVVTAAHPIAADNVCHLSLTADTERSSDATRSSRSSTRCSRAGANRAPRCCCTASRASARARSPRSPSAAPARRGATVLTMTGVPSESQLPYASLQGLLWPVMDDADHLPAPQRAALDAAWRADAPDPFRTGLAVLGLLGDAAERAPVVVVAEDAHWLDDATAEVLAFVARRIEADPIAMLITSREAIPRSLRGARAAAAASSRRSPPDAAEALLHARDPRLPARDAQADPGRRRRAIRSAWWSCSRAPRGPSRSRCRSGCRSARGWSGRSPPASPTSRTATRIALLVAALTDRADVTEVLAAASRVSGEPLGLEVLTPAIEAGLVELGRAARALRPPADALGDRAGRSRARSGGRRTRRSRRRSPTTRRARSGIASPPPSGPTTRSPTSSPRTRDARCAAARWSRRPRRSAAPPRSPATSAPAARGCSTPPSSRSTSAATTSSSACWPTPARSRSRRPTSRAAPGCSGSRACARPSPPGSRPTWTGSTSSTDDPRARRRRC